MKPEIAEQLFVKEMAKKSLKIEGDLEVVKLTGDASTRRYYRIGSGVRKYVACLDNPVKNEEDSDFVQIQKVFKENNIPVPAIIDSNLSSGYLLEEDLGDKTFLKELSNTKDSEDELTKYKKVLDVLINIHKIDSKKHKELIFSKRSFDIEKYMFEIEFTFKHFLKGFLGYDESEIPSGLNEQFLKICKKISDEKMVVTHRDFHSRNLMVNDSKLFVIDFQDARMGIPQYDLVSLLDDCYYKVCAKNREILKERYWNDYLKETGFQKSYEEFLYLYDLTLVQRVFKAIGSFSYIYKLRADVRYLKYIGFAFEKIRTTLLKYEEFNDLRKSLSTLYYER